MKKEIPKTYEPCLHEDGIYKKWEESGYFNPENLNLPKEAKNYSIVMPPPNVTGTLHMGHAVMLALEDILIRYHRMKGECTLWVPGTDHAAIATQTKVEKILKEEGTDRHKLGREKFLELVNKFAHESHDTIVNQVKKMGSSCDWSREAYTLDETRTRVVRTVFKMMYDDGLIYRGRRIVNWCPRCASTLADDEVEYKELKGKLYWIKYGPFILATTRPETKLGDTAVAVYPGDKRYEHMVGKKYMIPGVLGEFEITVVADKAVDPKFGSGAIKVTPAHDFADYEIAQRNDIGMRQVINEEGRMMENCGKYSGLTTREAREAIVADLEEMGLLDHVDWNYIHNIAVCYRCETQIEPIPSLQWFIDVNKKIRRQAADSRKQTADGRHGTVDFDGKSIKEAALEVVKSGKIKIVPERFEKNYYHWMENLRDWCISRQIWYGHRIPVWYKKDDRQKTDSLVKIWDLKIYGEEIFNGLKSGKKKIEARAGRPKGIGKYWGDIQSGDTIEFTLADEKTDQPIVPVQNIKKTVNAVKYFANLDEMLKVYKADDDVPGKDSNYFKNWWQNRPALYKRIIDHGIWVIELDNYHEEIYVGIEAPAGDGWQQDKDTLDTWFSSGLWTFSTLAHNADEININNGRLAITPPASLLKRCENDFEKFHPTSVLETGYDILFFWVARMIIMTTYAIGDIPFHDVYLHGLVLDEKGKKMSKSKGNTIDPLEMCQKYGTDATRLSLVMNTAPGADMKLWEEKVAGFRNFVNKLWNISRFIIGNQEVGKSRNQETEKLDAGNSECKMREEETPFLKGGENIVTLADEWILDKMDELIVGVTEDLENYRFAQAGDRLYAFTWGDLADWYLEVSKFEKNGKKKDVLSFVLANLLKLWHPFMPFVTEKIWSSFAEAKEDRDKLLNEKIIMIEKWPESLGTKFARAKKGNGRHIENSGGREGRSHSNDFELIKNIIIAIRNARSEHKIEPAKKIRAVIYAHDKIDLVKPQEALIKSLRTGIDELEILEKGERIDGAFYAAADGVEIFLSGAVDIEKEKARLEKEIASLEKLTKALETKLSNDEFVAKAPEQVVAKEKEKLEKYQDDLEKMRGQAGKLK